MIGKRGFTLIELLVVIAIIGVLSSVVLASLNTARTRANDAKIRTEVKQIQTAILLYYDRFGYFPASGYPTSYCSNHPDFLQPVIAAGLLAQRPIAPNNTTYPYCYYDYGAGSAPGAIVTGYLQASLPPTTAGYSGTCRPWGAGQNWCDQAINGYYCLCNQY